MEHWATLGQTKRTCLQIKTFQNISGLRKSFQRTIFLSSNAGEMEIYGWQ